MRERKVYGNISKLAWLINGWGSVTCRCALSMADSSEPSCCCWLDILCSPSLLAAKQLTWLELLAPRTEGKDSTELLHNQQPWGQWQQSTCHGFNLALVVNQEYAGVLVMRVVILGTVCLCQMSHCSAQVLPWNMLLYVQMFLILFQFFQELSMDQSTITQQPCMIIRREKSGTDASTQLQLLMQGGSVILNIDTVSVMPCSRCMQVKHRQCAGISSKGAIPVAGMQQ